MRDFNRNTSLESDSEMSGDEYSETINDSIYYAGKEDRLIKGIFESAHVLEICPDVVDICILPNAKSESISTHIQHKLIEAYCWENDIQILKLEQQDMTQMVPTQRLKSNLPASFECLLVTSLPVTEIKMDGMEHHDSDDNIS